MMLWNHGTLAVGETAAACWTQIFFLERACQMQVMAAAGGRGHLRMAPEHAIETVKMQQAATRGIGAMLAWPGRAAGEAATGAAAGAALLTPSGLTPAFTAP